MRSKIKLQIDRLMLGASFGMSFKGWIAMTKDKDQAFFGRGESPREAGEDLERVLAKAFDVDEAHA